MAEASKFMDKHLEVPKRSLVRNNEYPPSRVSFLLHHISPLRQTLPLITTHPYPHPPPSNAVTPIKTITYTYPVSSPPIPQPTISPTNPMLKVPLNIFSTPPLPPTSQQPKHNPHPQLQRRWEEKRQKENLRDRGTKERKEGRKEKQQC